MEGWIRISGSILVHLSWMTERANLGCANQKMLHVERPGKSKRLKDKHKA